jgi:predicted permease
VITAARGREDFVRDLRYAFRTLRREPALVSGVLLTLGLAIGATAAMFGLVTRLMLAPPPGIGEPGNVARLHFRVAMPDGQTFSSTTTSYPSYLALRDAAGAFAGVAASKPDTVLVGRSPDVTQLGVLAATGNYFTTLRAVPALGRFFGPGDDELPAGNSVVVLGHSYWQRAFGGERSVLGREILIDDQPFTIVGVAPANFNGDGMAPVDAYLPFAAAMRKSGSGWASNRYMNLVTVLGRIREGVTQVAASQIASAALRDGTSSGGRARDAEVELESIVPGRAARQSPQAQIAIWLTGVSVVVLLIATANVGTLLSLRAAKRRRDLAVRIAMGAGRGDLAQQLLIESMLLALLGAGAGLLISRWLSQIIRATLLPNLAASESVIDSRILITSLLAAIIVGLVAGLAPLSQTSRSGIADELRAGGGQASGRLAFQTTLVARQVALCTVLLVGAALFVRSLNRVQSQDLGFSTDRLLYVTLDFRGYAAGAERDLAYEEAVTRLRAVPGVSAATVVAGIPFGPHNIPPVAITGIPWPPTGQIPIMYGATPEYLDVMGVKLIAGRSITKNDRRGSALVVLVNETLAKTAWPGESALGKCVRAGFGAGFQPTEDVNPAEATPCREVVGVVRDSRARSLRPERDEDRLMQYYVPFDQMPDKPMPDLPNAMGAMVRVNGDLDRMAGLVQRTIQSSSERRVFAHVRPYQDLIDPQLRSWRLGATLFSSFGVLALAIASVGLFGIVSYVVTQRTRELGVRLALGATAASVSRLVVNDAIRMAGIGIAAGLAGALAAGPLIASMLFQTSAHEPASLAVATIVLLVTTVLAASWPAWRAGRVQPTVALRADG